jgi:hypothetical protein
MRSRYKREVWKLTRGHAIEDVVARKEVCGFGEIGLFDFI